MLIAKRQSTTDDSAMLDKCTRVFVTTTSEYTKAGIGITYRENASQPSIIDWGDGTVQAIDGDIYHVVHDYETAGDFIITVSNLSAFSLDGYDWSWRTSTSQDYYTVKRVDIGITVKTILAKSFSYLNNLSVINISNSVLSVGSNAFENIEGVTGEFVIPDSVKYIDGYGLFYNNQNNLTSIILPENATIVHSSEMLFCACKVMEKYRLPKNMTSFDPGVFNQCLKLTYVDIPPTLTVIYGTAFLQCSALSAVNIVDLSSWCGISYLSVMVQGEVYGVATMQPLNFAHGLYIDGQLITDLSIPSGITEIKDYAFYSCSKSTSLEIPDTVSSIGRQAFYNCTGLSSIAFGDGIASIGYQAFYGCNKVSTLHLPDSLLSIGEYAFGYCSKIQNARIPNGCVSSIGQYAFTNLTSLNDMLFHGLVTDEISALPDYPWGIATNKISAMRGDATYAYVTYIDSTTARFKIVGELKANDIADLQDATNIVVDNGLISIAPSAFANCGNLISVDLPGTLSAIGRDAFIRCSSLTCLKLRKKAIDEIQSMEDYPWGIVDESIIRGIQPTMAKFIDGTTSSYNVNVITSSLIQPANNVIELSVSEDVIDISSYAFRNFINLSSVTMNEGLTCIGMYAFTGCSSLISIDVPDGVVSVGNYAFASCLNLVSISLPDTLTNTGTYVFRNDVSLNHVKMPNHMQSLGSGAFMSCTSLVSCDIPIGLSSLTTQTFGVCISLAQAAVPWTVTSMGNAFIRCFSLSSLTCYALSAPTVTTTTFGSNVATYAGLSVTGPKTLHVPTGATGYEASYWLSTLLNPSKCGFTISYEDELLSPFLTKMEFMDGDVSSCNWSSQTMALKDYIEQYWGDDTWTKWMTKIEIGNQFTTIEDSTFYELTTLTDVKIPYSVTTCEENAFIGCTGLTSIVVEGKPLGEAKKMLEGTGIPANCQITVT